MYIDGRMKKIEEGTNIDWSTAEAMAIGSLLMQGFMCRISGQDVGMTRNFEDKVTASQPPAAFIRNFSAKINFDS